jgi:2-iminobutanoate/2-iminopropanoate deaminase
VGPYSPGILASGTFVFVAGQVGLERGSDRIASSVAAQTVQALRNIEAILREAGGSLRDLVKVNVFLADLGDFAVMNDAYARVVPSPPPTRTTVECVLPAGILVEIDGIACLRG